MDQGVRNERFDESIYYWSLAFINPHEEQLYQQEMTTNPPTPYMMKVVAVLVVAISIFYRLLTLSSALLGLSAKTAGLTIELIFCGVVVGAALAELILYICGWCPRLQGVLIYTTLNCISPTAAFYTQKAPVFGMM
jgi:hypothetical protein